MSRPIYYCTSGLGCELFQLSASEVEDQCLHIFSGQSFMDLRKEAAHELFELYYPEEYAVWEKSLCDGLVFDEDRFLDSPAFSTTELKISGTAFLTVAAA